MTKEWDVFISHASEDKDLFVRPLAQTLAQLGVRVWYDEFTLAVGDSLSRSIDEGLIKSSFGVVVISHSFLQKKWPERELRALTQREVLQQRKVILPVWLDVTPEEIMSFSPTLSDAYAIRADRMEAKQVASELLKVIRPDIDKQNVRFKLDKMVAGGPLDELQRELDMRQLKRFLRASSAITGEMKEVLSSLSIITSNLERHFNNTQFDSEVVTLISTTERLRRLLAKLIISAPALQIWDDTEVLRRLQPIDLVEVIKRVLSRPFTRTANAIEVITPPSIFLRLPEDALETIIQNLVRNAVEATGPATGKITIEAGIRENQVFLTVIDTGVGMSRDFVETQLLKPFSTTKRNRMGLGLFAAWELVKAFGGSLEVFTKENSGTTFTIVWPNL